MRRNLFFDRLGLIGLSVLMTLFSVSLNAQDLSDGLVLHYDFASETLDATGNGYDGVLYNGATVTVEDEKNVAEFVQSSSSYIQVDTASGFDDALATMLNYTISCHVKLTTRSGWVRVWDFGSGTGYYMFLTTSQGSSSGGVRFAIKNGGGEEQLTAQDPLPIGEWAHVVVTVEGSVGKLYVDGIEVASHDNLTLSPVVLGASNFTQLYLGKSQWPDPYLDGYIADFRIYNRAVSETEVFMLGGIPVELLNAKEAVTTGLGDLSYVSANLTLPTTSNGVDIAWTSSKPGVVDSTGVITQDPKYAATATLTAVFSIDGKSITQDYLVTVAPLSEGDILVAKWNFKDTEITEVNEDSLIVTDLSENAFVGTVKNDANIITIGESVKYNVLSLGAGTGYFDMGTEIGKAIYSLTDFTIGTYFRIEEAYDQLDWNGNFIWNFSNTDDAPTDMNGYMIGSLKNTDVSITSGYWASGNQAVGSGMGNAGKGAWHHFAYVQEGTTGKVYMDGVEVGSGSMTNLLSVAVAKDSLPGTLYNWIGRSCYPGDVYLRQTLIYDVALYNVAASSDDIPYVFGDEDQGLAIADVLAELNTAYEENPIGNFPEELNTEAASLDLGDLSAVTSDITLPFAGVLDPTIKITWSSAIPGVVSDSGVVVRPDYLGRDVTLTATFSKNRYKVEKSFVATVLPTEETIYSSDLLLNYNFASNLINDSIVTDAAEMAFEGTLKNGAFVKTLNDGFADYNVLKLPNDSAYFDMGSEFGKVVYGLAKNYSLSIYFFVDEMKSNFTANGNFVCTFANSDSSDFYHTGYMFMRPASNEFAISSEYWAAGNQAINDGSVVPVEGAWYHMVYVQNDTMGVVYMNGDTVSSGVITNYPFEALPKEGLTGTDYNFIGKPNFSGDTYLGEAMLYDFKVYNKSLSYSEVAGMQDVRDGLDIAYFLSLSTGDLEVASIDVTSSVPGVIRIDGKDAGQLVEVYDITGRTVTTTYENSVAVNAGIYIVKVGSAVEKVIVK